MNPITIANTLPPHLVALSPEIAEHAAGLVASAKSIAITDVASLEQAEALLRQIAETGKNIHEGRMVVTRQIDSLKSALIDAAEKATIPLTDAKKDLSANVMAYRRELEKQQALAEKKAREEAEARAQAERVRLEAERQAKIAAQRAAYEAEKAAAEAERQRLEVERQAVIAARNAAHAAEVAAAEAQRKMLLDEDPFAEVADIAVPQAPSEPPPVMVEAPPAPSEPPPVVVVPVVERLPVAALGKSAVRSSTRQRLVIDNPTIIPREIAGAVLMVPDEKAIEKLLRAGVFVSGCRLETYEVIGMNGK